MVGSSFGAHAAPQTSRSDHCRLPVACCLLPVACSGVSRGEQTPRAAAQREERDERDEEAGAAGRGAAGHDAAAAAPAAARAAAAHRLRRRADVGAVDAHAHRPRRAGRRHRRRIARLHADLADACLLAGARRAVGVAAAAVARLLRRRIEHQHPLIDEARIGVDARVVAGVLARLPGPIHRALVVAKGGHADDALGAVDHHQRRASRVALADAVQAVLQVDEAVVDGRELVRRLVLGARRRARAVGAGGDAVADDADGVADHRLRQRRTVVRHRRRRRRIGQDDDADVARAAGAAGEVAVEVRLLDRERRCLRAGHGAGEDVEDRTAAAEGGGIDAVGGGEHDMRRDDRAGAEAGHVGAGHVRHHHDDGRIAAVGGAVDDRLRDAAGRAGRDARRQRGDGQKAEETLHRRSIRETRIRRRR